MSKLSNGDLFQRHGHRRRRFPFHKGYGKGNTAHPAAVHEENDDQTGEYLQFSGDACGNAYGTHSGEGFKKHIRQFQILHTADGNGTKDHKNQIDKKYINGFVQGVFFQPSAKNIGTAGMTHPSQSIHKNDHQCSGLDAAGSGAGAAADEHEEHHEHFAAAGHGAGIDAVKACRSGGTRLEKGCEQSFAVAHIHIQIVPLQKQQQKAAANGQGERCT